MVHGQAIILLWFYVTRSVESLRFVHCSPPTWSSDHDPTQLPCALFPRPPTHIFCSLFRPGISETPFVVRYNLAICWELSDVVRAGTVRPFRLCWLIVPEAIEIINEVLVTTLWSVHLVEVLHVGDDIKYTGLGTRVLGGDLYSELWLGSLFRILVECFSVAPGYCCAWVQIWCSSSLPTRIKTRIEKRWGLSDNGECPVHILSRSLFVCYDCQGSDNLPLIELGLALAMT